MDDYTHFEFFSNILIVIADRENITGRTCEGTCACVDSCLNFFFLFFNQKRFPSWSIGGMYV